MEHHFNIHRRNPGHWDVTTDQGRAFAIRGERGDVVVRDERGNGRKPNRDFKSLTAAMVWVTEELMTE
jgi:hypothetical protein